MVARRDDRVGKLRKFLRRNASALAPLFGPVGPLAEVAHREMAHRAATDAEAAAMSHVRAAVRQTLSTPLLARSSPLFAYDRSLETTLLSLADDLRARPSGDVWFSSGHAERLRLLAADLADLSHVLGSRTAIDAPIVPASARESLRRLQTALAEASRAAGLMSDLHAEIAWHEQRNTEADPIASVRLSRSAVAALTGPDATYARAILTAVETAERIVETDAH